MLFSFSIKNFKSFKNEFTLDLSKSNGFEFNEECIKNDVINKALIYGPNGIGKSNLCLAIFDLISHLTDKNKTPDSYKNYLNAENDSDIAEFKFVFKFENDRVEYLYGKETYDNIIYEKVLINDQLIISYDRRSDNEVLINLKGAETLNKDLQQIKISVLKYIKTSTVLVNDKINTLLNKFFFFIDNMLMFKSLNKFLYQGYETGSNVIFDIIINKGHFEDFNLFLNKSGIECKLKYTEINNEKQVFFDFGEKSIEFWGACSTGTKSLTLFYYWLLHIKYDDIKPTFVFIDEFDAFYHMEVSRLIVSELKKSDCQVILTTHNTSLMTNDLLRPDCYFVMHKDKITNFPHLTNKELRRAHNIEKMYRAGVFSE